MITSHSYQVLVILLCDLTEHYASLCDNIYLSELKLSVYKSDSHKRNYLKMGKLFSFWYH